MGFFKNFISKLSNSLNDDNLEKSLDKLNNKGYDLSSLLEDSDYGEMNQKLYSKIEDDIEDIMETFSDDDTEFDEDELNESNVESTRKEIERIYAKKQERLDKVIEIVRKKNSQELEGNDKRALNGILEKIRKERIQDFEEDKNEDLQPVIAVENRIKNRKKEEERQRKIEEEIDKGIVAMRLEAEAERLRAINAMQNSTSDSSEEDDDDEEDKAEINDNDDGNKVDYTQSLYDDLTVRKVQENFNEEFPYLRLGVFLVKSGQKADKEGGKISPIPHKTIMKEIRAFKGECEIAISGDDTPASIEKKFRNKSGLVVKICYNDEDDHRFYISNKEDEYNKTLSQLNAEFRERGYQTAEIS